MKCAYCLEEMNEGASVCRVCGRTQPRSPEQRLRRAYFIAVALIVAIPAGVGAYFVYDSIAEQQAIENALACYHTHGLSNYTEKAMRDQLALLDGIRHDGWRTNLEVMNTFVAGCGAP
jgi:hypothetical protein